MSHDYAALYEQHARQAPDPMAAVGLGDPKRFDEIGRIQLAILVAEGLCPDGALLDFGCGVGRLALHAIPYLARGRYVGVDIAPTMIEHAKRTIAEKLPSADASRMRLDVGDGETLARFGDDFDIVCAFSVFTHIEHEDSLRALRQCLAALKRGGKVVCSVLPIETEAAKLVLLDEAALAPNARWQRVRNVTTSFAMMEAIARLAGFLNFRWYHGDAFSVVLPDGRAAGFRQSVLVAEKP